MGHQSGEVIQPLTEGGQGNGEDVEPEEEVLPEGAGGDLVLQPPVGGRDHAHVHPQRILRPDPLQLAGLQRPQQLGLRLGAQVPDLVEEERPLVGQLEAAETALGRPGEGAALVAEHLRLDQIARDRRAVDGDEGAARAAARRVHGGRDQLLPGAGFPGDQHPRLGGPDPRDQSADLLHGGAVAHQISPPAQLGLQGAVLRPGPVQLQRRAHRHQHRLGGQRLLQELERAELHGAHRVGQLGLAAHHDDRGEPAPVAQPGERLQAVGARRHQEVQEDDVGIGLVHHQQRRVAVARLRHAEPLLAEQRAEHPADVGLVVHQQDLPGDRPHSPRSLTTKVAPPPRVRSTATVPRCSSIVCLARASPSPVPPSFPVQ